jgi:hypothetical protein
MDKRLRIGLGAFGLALLLCPAVRSPAQDAGNSYPRQARGAQTRSFSVDGRVALAALISLSDGHLQKLADSLEFVAASAAAQSGDWEKIRGPLAEIGKQNVPAALWFALPNGSYWTVEQGRMADSLATRPYFRRALAGQRMMGDLVVSKSTGKSVAIVAVRIVRQDRSVLGVLGASVYLDRLSALIRQEMALDESLIFYSFDAAPLLALEWDPGLIFVDPTRLGEEVGHAFREMLSHEKGTVTYTFRGAQRTVLYRKSPLTGWWYALGAVHPNPDRSRAAQPGEMGSADTTSGRSQSPR